MDAKLMRDWLDDGRSSPQDRNTRGHYDVPLRDCTVELDGKVIIERGRIVDDKMRVARVQRQ